jgi:predicted DsbA family dithiol-disulfide isomerase
MSIVSQTALDSLFAGYFNQERAVPNEAELQQMASRCGLSVDQVKDAFAEKWRAAGNLDDPFGRNPEDEEEDDE